MLLGRASSVIAYTHRLLLGRKDRHLIRGQGL